MSTIGPQWASRTDGRCLHLGSLIAREPRLEMPNGLCLSVPQRSLSPILGGAKSRIWLLDAFAMATPIPGLGRT